VTPQEIESTVVRVLSTIAPEADPGQLKQDVNLRDQIDIDSMDFLNFVVALHKQFRVEIPEKDYPLLATIRGCVQYLSIAGERPVQT
jgi:acyl carrier protein